MANGRDDLRLAVGWIDHAKTLRLIEACGAKGALCLLRLWSYAAQNCATTGNIGRPDDVERIARWKGKHGVFHAALVEIGWLDPDGATLHDWIQEQPWLSSREDRIVRNRERGARGGRATADKHTPEERAEGARKAASARWGQGDGDAERDAERMRTGRSASCAAACAADAQPSYSGSSPAPPSPQTRDPDPEQSARGLRPPETQTREARTPDPEQPQRSPEDAVAKALHRAVGGGLNACLAVVRELLAESVVSLDAIARRVRSKPPNLGGDVFAWKREYQANLPKRETQSTVEGAA